MNTIRVQHPWDRPTVDEVREQMIEHEVAMIALGRAITPLVNAMLRDLVEKLNDERET